MPKISVIIPVYNVEAYLQETLDCLYFQTFKDLEIICVDDGSTDSSLSLLQEYSKKDFRVKIISQPNKGQNFARNVGLKYANGDYIHFLDSDDLLNRDFYKKLYNNAIKNNTDLVYCSCLKFGEEIQDTEEYPFSNNGKPLQEWTTSTVWFFLVKRKYVFDFETSLKKYGEDDLFSFLLFRKINSVSVEKDAIYYYRQRKNSTMSSKIDEYNFVSDRFIVIDNILNYGLKNPLSFEQCQSAYFNMINEEINAMGMCRRVSLKFLYLFIPIFIKMHLLFKECVYKCSDIEIFKRFLNVLRKGLISVKIKKNLFRITLYGRDIVYIGEIK